MYFPVLLNCTATRDHLLVGQGTFKLLDHIWVTVVFLDKQQAKEDHRNLAFNFDSMFMRSLLFVTKINLLSLVVLYDRVLRSSHTFQLNKLLI